MFEVQTQEFVGPLEKLLELIEEKKMDITQVSLAQVTADFLAYIEEIKKAVLEQERGDTQLLSPRVLSDFLVVASHLLLIKSRSALPNLELTQDEEQGIEELEKRLKIYQEIRPMVGALRSQWEISGQLFSRTSLYHFGPVFYPPASLTKEDLWATIKKMVTAIAPLFLEEEKIERRLISLEAKIKEIAQKISNGIKKFSQVSKDGSKEEIIVLFLAVLHLLRDRILRVRQDDVFGDFEIERMGASEE